MQSSKQMVGSFRKVFTHPSLCRGGAAPRETHLSLDVERERDLVRPVATKAWGADMARYVWVVTECRYP